MKVLLKKSLVFVLICSMVFSTTSFSVLADGINNESVGKNESTEESENAEDDESVEADESVEDEESVGASSASPEEVEPEDESVGANSVSPDKETDANSVSPDDETEDTSSASPDKETDANSASPEENEPEDVEPEEHKKSSDGLYGNASDPLLYIYYADSNYTPADKNGHVQGLQVRPEVFADYVSNPNNPYNQFYEILQAVTGVWLPATMTFKGFHFVSDQIIPDDWMEQYDIFEGFKQNYTHDTSVDYANAADIVWDGTHDMVLYTVYESISFKVMYFDENDTVQTETFDTNNVENDLDNFLQSIEQIEIEGKTFKGYKQLTTEDEISGYTGEATSDDSDGNFAVLVSFNNWKENPNASVTWAAFYNITRYFNVIYIKDHADFVSKTNSYKTYTAANDSSSFTGTNGDINKLYKKGPYYDNDDFFETVGIEEVSSFTSQSELAALVASPSTCLAKSGTTDVSMLVEKFNAWKNNGYPTKNVCWVVKCAGAYRWYGATKNQLGGGPSNVNSVESVRRQFFGLIYSAAAFNNNNEFYAYTQGDIPKLKSFKGLKIVPYTEILTANPTDIRKYYLENYYFNEDAVNDTSLKTPAELEQIYKAWSESSDDIYNSYAAFIVYETAPKELQEFGFGTYPTKMTYFEGETFNPAALVLTLVYKNGYPNESLAYAGNEDKITFELPSGEDALTTALARDGNNSTVAITVKYGGCSNTFNLTVNEVPKVIDSISIVTEPTKSYIEGQTFDPTNLVIKVKYEDNSEENITYNNTTQNNFSFTLPSGDDALTTQLTTGNPTVTVGYMGKTTPLALTVAAKQVTGIDITTEPKKAYNAGENFDPSGLIINVTYDNGTNEEIDYNDHKSDFSFEIEGMGAINENTVLNTADDYNVKVKYKGQEDSYQMNVRAIERLQPVNNGTTTYIEGQTFNPAGLSFKVIYTNGDEETIEYNNTPDGITFNPSITTPLKISDNKVTVSYKGFSYDITLNVSEDTRKVETVEITTPQDKKEYEQGQSFNGTGMVIHVTYDDSSDAYIPYNTDFSFDPSVLNDIGDDIKVGVTYKGIPSSNKAVVKVNKKTTPKPSNPSNSGSSSSSSDSDSDEPSDPTKGPMGDLTKNPVKNYTPVKPVENTIPLNKLLIDPALVAQVKASSDNDSTAYANARDVDNNTGYGEWLRVGKSSVWYFLTSDFNQGLNNEPLGFLRSGWFNLGWDGLDKWYYFDGEGVMKMGWYNENGKTYYLETDINYNWYGEAVTGTRVIDGKTYHFGEDYALIQ